MNRMLYFKSLCIVTGCLVMACSENNDVENFQPQTYNIMGKVEKGPFVSGSTIAIQPMDAKMQPSGETYTSTILDNAGSFTFGSKLFEVPFAELIANGYFFNEVSGNLSSGTLNLRAIVDLSDKSTINVNILTHLKYQRILNLIAQGKEFKEANKQAQDELFAAFGLAEYSQTDASQFSIVKENDEAAALIAVSSLLLIDRSEAALTEYLAKLSHEFGQDGKFSTETKEQIKKDRENLADRLERIKDNIVNRYTELGLSVKVKDLACFLDWDDNGVAGDEILKEGERVEFEPNQIEIPNEGGTYQIKIKSPIPIYLEPKKTNIFDSTSQMELYKDKSNLGISVEKSLANNVLTIEVAPLNSKTEMTVTIPFYDYLDRVVGKIELIQTGNENATYTLPLLGKDAEAYINNMAKELAKGLSIYCLLEQYYHYNKQTDLVNQYIYPNCSPISDCWSAFYTFNRQNLTLKEADAQQLCVWQDIFNVFSAMQYYYMITAWGAVPYITNPNYDPFASIPRTDVEDILRDLQNNLTQAMTTLDERKNESPKDANGLFFMSKDVARFLLANTYMYQHDYNQAAVLLHDIIGNGFYELDDTNFSEQESIEKLVNDKDGKEVIFALYADVQTKASTSTTIQTPPVIPLMTYTDVILSYAECLYKQGNEVEARKQLESVAEAKNIIVDNDTWSGIVEARKQLLLYSNSNFAFMKRNNIAKEEYGVEEYRLLWPIPERDLILNPNLTQNPGY